MRTTTSGRNNGIQWTLLTQPYDLDFADDMAFLLHNHRQMQDKTTHLVTSSAGTGLKINLKKTELMKINTTVQLPVTVKVRKWGWIGHTLRKPPSSTTRQALTWNPQGKRKRGRPRNTWRRDSEAELKAQDMTWHDAAKAAQNRVRWRTVVDGLCSSRNDRPK
ncbi:uncharacterized protein LOC125658580 [Ostrea edulis]|uniref:uncharacterized protein LOC125658580 n=1 Tax=Ostrea edulis TaxID=37623 RepID=UPI00209414C7|nr:uncharacterized protein LOC125658580 [Ostrea edulis]